jgi:hypothetical protein
MVLLGKVLSKDAKVVWPSFALIGVQMSFIEIVHLLTTFPIVFFSKTPTFYQFATENSQYMYINLVR